MRWRRHRKTAEKKEREEALLDAQRQLRDAEHDLEVVRERTSEIKEISRTLRRLREQNHFAPLVWEAFGGRDR